MSRNARLAKARHTAAPSKPRKARRLLTLAAIVFATAFIVFACMFARACLQTGQEQEAFVNLKESLGASDQGQDIIQEKTGDSKGNAYQALYDQNSDFAAWLEVPGTNIDYPVMSTPSDPEYYLYRAFDKSDSQSGTPFIGKGCDLDSTVLIVYGHNMASGTMFGTLDRYASADFWSQNKKLTLTTGAKQSKYEVFAAVQTQVNSPEKNPDCLPFSLTGDISKDDYDKLVSLLAANALYDTGTVPAYGEQILLLATCSYHTSDGRFVVAARKVS